MLAPAAAAAELLLRGSGLGTLLLLSAPVRQLRHYAQAARQHVQEEPVVVSSSAAAAGSSSSRQHQVGPHNSSSSSAGVLQQHATLQQWQSIAQLSAEDAERLLAQHPSLQSYLSRAGCLHPSSYLVNVACLSVHPAQLLAPQHAALRGLLALVPPGVLHALIEQDPQLQHQHHHQQQPWRHHAQPLADLQACLLQALGPVRPLQHHLRPAQPPASGAQDASSLGHADSMFQVSQAVAAALGLPADFRPEGNTKLHRLLTKAVHRSAESSSSRSNPSSPTSSSSPSSPFLASSNSSSLKSSTTRSFASMTQPATATTGLTRVLEVAARASHLRSKPVHSPASAAQWIDQLQQQTGMDSSDVLQLLLSRPSLLWQHRTAAMPGELLSHLQQLLPDLAGHDTLRGLVVQQPGLLSCSNTDLQAAVDVLTGRLQLSATEAAQLVLRHPRLLVAPVRQVLPNIGFLVGLGLSAGDLRAMALRNPKWITRSLRQLMLQWQFLQQFVKSRPQDLVLCPELLTLPVLSRLGPRVMYARKRNIKLLQPGVAAAAGGSSSLARGARAGLLAHGMVCLDEWLSVSDKQMCRLAGVELEDYTRFKQAWGRVDGAHWQRATSNQS